MASVPTSASSSTGDDLDVLRRTAERLSTVISETPGAADVRIDMQRGLRVIDVKPVPRQTARLGVPTADVLAFMELLQNGREIGKLREGQRSFDVALRVMTPTEPRRRSAE